MGRKVDEDEEEGRWNSPRDKLRFADLAPRDRFCDLILTGGVTSAVAYPGLVAKLASAYRFHSIGGSSSGAGIAAMAAAAEYRRRRGSAEGFRIMLERVGALAEERRGGTRLSGLFQPGRGQEWLFDRLVATFATASGGQMGTFVRGWLGPWALGWITIVAVTAALCWIDRLTKPLGIAIGGWALVAIVAGAALQLAFAVRRAVRNDYGLCSGLAPSGRTPGPSDDPPLMEWLHDVIQEIAGRGRDDPPLTFADLEGAPGSPRAALGAGGGDADKGVVLQMFSANVSHGRPYRFPQPVAGGTSHAKSADDVDLYFRERDLRKVVPAPVVDYLLSISGDQAWEDDAMRDERTRYRLPRARLPIVLAARMSMSFPVLFTAVRLWAREGRGAGAALKPCLFVDGGLCSNFPIHLFDSAIPGWPTFGLSLRDAGDGATADVTLPVTRAQGQEETWYHVDPPDPDDRCAKRSLAELLRAMLWTTKDWNDASSARLPGVWDRVARITPRHGQGGLNIAMPKDAIDALAIAGVEAGDKFLDRFGRANAPGNGFAIGWNEHRWRRLIRLRDALATYLRGASWSIALGPHAEPLAAQIRRARDTAPLHNEGSAPLSPAQAAALEQFVAALAQAERALDAPGMLPPDSPEPDAVLRIRAPT